MLSEQAVSVFKQAWDRWESACIAIPEYYEPLALGRSDKDEVAQPAEAAIAAFMQNPNKKVLLILGTSGSGKSCLGQKLACDLRAKWKSHSDYLPLWISLAKQNQIDGEFVERFLEKELKVAKDVQAGLNIPWLFILDGYDELKPDYAESNLHRIAELARWDAKVIITCRNELAPTVSKQIPLFAPYTIQGTQDKQGLETLYLQLLTIEQQERYLRNCFKEAQNSVEAWKRMPGLQELGRTPFVLSLIARHLPTILEKNKGKDSFEQLVLTRLDLYRAFKDDWFEKQRTRLLKQSKIQDGWEIEKDFEEYTQRLARELYRKKLTSFKIPYNAALVLHDEKEKAKAAQPKTGSSVLSFSEEHTISSVKHSMEDPLVALLSEKGLWQCKDGASRPLELVRQGCPLSSLGKGEWSFLHKSLLEYFASERFFQSMANQVGIALGVDLNTELLVEDLSFMQFAADEVKKNKDFKGALWRVLKESRHESRVQIAAANAISILNWAGELFSHQDLRRVRVPGANLAGAVLDSTDLSDADLRNVDLEGAWLNNANLQRACLDNIVLHQLPYLRFEDPINHCCCSPDGQWLAVAVAEKIVLYDRDFKLKNILKGHIKVVETVVISRDGKILASGSQDNTVKLWDIEKGILKHTFDGFQGLCNVALCEKGLLAYSTNKDTIVLWDINTRALKNTFSGHTHAVRTVAISEDGKMLASGSQDKTIKLWDIEKGTLKYTFDEQGDGVYSVAFSNNGLLASGSDDVKLWDIEKGILKHTFDGRSGFIREVAFSADTKLLVAGGEYTIRVWDIDSFALKYTFEGHKGGVNGIAFFENRLVSSGRDNIVKFLSLEGRCLKSKPFEGHGRGVNSVALSRDGFLASGSWDKTIKIWDINSCTLKCTFEGHSEGIKSVAFSDNGLLASGSADHTIKLWDISSSTLKHTFGDHSGLICSVAFSKDGLLASGSYQVVKLWDIAGRTLKRAYGSHFSLVFSVAFAPNGILASGGLDGRIKAWYTKNDSLRFLHNFQAHSDAIYSIAFSTDGRLLASGGKDKTVEVWDMERYTSKTLKGHNDEVTSVVFSNNGLLASGSNDGTVRLWDIQKCVTLQILECLDQVASVIFSANNRYLVVATGSTILLWQRHPDNNPVLPFTLLYRFNKSPKLSAHALNLTQVTGMTQESNSYRLLTQMRATGLPNAKQNSEAILRQREEAEYCEKPIAPLLEVQGSNFLLTPGGTWIAAFVRDKTSQNPSHVFLLLESVESISEERYPAYHRFKRIDLFLDDRFENSNYFGLNWRGKSVIVMAEKGIEDIKALLENCQYKSYPLDPQQAKTLIANIEQEQKSPPNYHLIGNTSTIGTGHNCLTWGEAMLTAVGCNVQHQTSWLDYIVAHPDRRGLTDHQESQEAESTVGVFKNCVIS